MEDLIYAKVKDKVDGCKKTNKITYTDFLVEPEIIKVENYLKEINFKDYLFFGGNKNGVNDRKMCFFYPKKFDLDIVLNYAKSILKIIRIILPNGLKYEHKDFLSAIMKLGVVREKFGDIVVFDNGADIVVKDEMTEYFKLNLENFTRFKNATIEIRDIDDLSDIKKTSNAINVTVSSLRIDNIVSSLIGKSRTKTNEILNDERVSINYEIVTKPSKLVNVGDIIVIRGYGRFKYNKCISTTKNGRYILEFLH